ncbi:MAG: DinB family protein [Chloroflexota bacterium]
MDPQIAALHKLSTTRIYNAVEALTPDEWFAMPTGFDNNIAWNIGHLLFVQQMILYRRSGLTPNVPETYGPMFKPGTFPSDWSRKPDIAEMLSLMKNVGDQVVADAAAGQFAGFEGMEIGGVPLPDINSGASFNLWHDGLHLGVIGALKNAL